MTPEEKVNDFLEFYNHKVPDPTHYPKQFEYYLRLYNYYKGSTKYFVVFSQLGLADAKNSCIIGFIELRKLCPKT